MVRDTCNPQKTTELTEAATFLQNNHCVNPVDECFCITARWCSMAFAYRTLNLDLIRFPSSVSVLFCIYCAWSQCQDVAVACNDVIWTSRLQDALLA